MTRRRSVPKRIRPSAWRRIMRFAHKRKNQPTVIAATLIIALCSAATVGVLYKSMHPRINPIAYKPLLDTIADGESKGNYNAYYGHQTNTTLRFTSMSIRDVLQWQEKYVQDGNPSSAVGRYQIVRPTLTGLVRQLELDPDAHFTEALQDQLAIALMERRGSVEYVQKKISREQFADNLDKEWAALPKMTSPNPAESYYAGDGLNASRVSIGAVYTAVDHLKR
jgi:conjugal transfer mating pair stabilization protein TraG